MGNHFPLELILRTYYFLARNPSTVSNTLSLHDALPICNSSGHLYQGRFKSFVVQEDEHLLAVLDRKGTRLNSRQPARSDADLCLSRQDCDAKTAVALVSVCPIERPANWKDLFNRGGRTG